MKKLRLKKKNATIALLMLIFIIIEIINPSRIIAVNKLMKHGYSKEASKEIIKKGIKSQVLNDEYSKFIDLNIFDGNFVKENYDYYSLIKFNNQIDLKIVNDIKKKKYTEEEASLIINRGNIDEIQVFLNKDKYENISDYLQFDYSKLGLLDKYIEYKKVNGESFENSVTYVNIGLDKDFYTEYKEINDFSITMLVNKYNKLSENFVPMDLVSFPTTYCSSTCPMDNKEAVEAFVNMAMTLKEEENLNIYVNSAYRSYHDQNETYERLTKLYGANYDVAKAGFSEHQTGLSVDIGSGSSKTFKGSKEEAWLKLNAHKYGFILRYDSSKTKITGYNEPWHFRYVGVDVAKDIYSKKITFDEYYVRYIER